MVASLLSFSAVAVSVRALAGSLNIFEILAIRNSVGLLVLGAIAIARPRLRSDLLPRYMGLHLARNALHFGAQFGWTLSLTLLPLATVFALEFTMPGWLAVLAVIFLGERMTTGRFGSIALSFAGVLIILRPGLEAFQPAALLMLAVAIGFAIIAIMTKKLTNVVSAFVVVFWMNAIQLPMSLAGTDLSLFSKLGTAQILPALAIGACGLSAHFCLAKAFRSGEATVVVPLDFMRIPLIALVGWLFYAEPLDPFVFAGAGMIVAGIVWNLRAEALRTARLATPVRPAQ
jgi:drug/metabolite transporter (DMT)-like permease